MSQINSENQIETFLQEIKIFPLFANYEQSLLRQLFTDGKMRASKHREILYTIGSSATKFSLVLRGAYKLVRPTPRGEDVIVYFSAPGDVIGALVMTQPNAVYPVSAIAMGPSLVLEIPQATYLKYWAQNSELTIHLQSLLYHRMILLQDEKLFNKSPLENKIAHLLLKLMERYSAESDGILPIPVTRKEIADAIGSTVESVIRIMSDWSHQEIIATSEHHIEILKAGRIVELGQSG